MANMSYCRMRNTRSDLLDCISAVNDNEYNEDSPISVEEGQALRSMIINFMEFIDEQELLDEDGGLDECLLDDFISRLRGIDDKYEEDEDDEEIN